jgi:hypothetical protein
VRIPLQSVCSDWFGTDSFYFDAVIVPPRGLACRRSPESEADESTSSRAGDSDRTRPVSSRVARRDKHRTLETVELFHGSDTAPSPARSEQSRDPIGSGEGKLAVTDGPIAICSPFCDEKTHFLFPRLSGIIYSSAFAAITTKISEARVK